MQDGPLTKQPSTHSTICKSRTTTHLFCQGETHIELIFWKKSNWLDSLPLLSQLKMAPLKLKGSAENGETRPRQGLCSKTQWSHCVETLPFRGIEPRTWPCPTSITYLTGSYLQDLTPESSWCSTLYHLILLKGRTRDWSSLQPAHLSEQFK